MSIDAACMTELEEYEREERADKLWQRMSAETFTKRLAEISTLTKSEYLHQRKALAQELGVPVGMLDAEHKKRAKQVSESVMQPHWNVEPWHEPVKGRELLGEISARIKRHVMMSEAGRQGVALWVAFAWMHDAAVHSPILLVSSPEAECGKTTLLGLINFMVPRGLLFVEGTSSVIYRLIEKCRPTLIIDEADTVFKNNPELRAVNLRTGVGLSLKLALFAAVVAIGVLSTSRVEAVPVTVFFNGNGFINGPGPHSGTIVFGGTFEYDTDWADSDPDRAGPKCRSRASRIGRAGRLRPRDSRYTIPNCGMAIGRLNRAV